MKIEAKKTQQELLSSEALRQKAADIVKNLLNDSTFSFETFVQKEELVFQNRNLDSFTQEDIEHTLTEYFYLKFISEQQNQKNSIGKT